MLSPPRPWHSLRTRLGFAAGGGGGCYTVKPPRPGSCDRSAHQASPTRPGSEVCLPQARAAPGGRARKAAREGPAERREGPRRITDASSPASRCPLTAGRRLSEADRGRFLTNGSMEWSREQGALRGLQDGDRPGFSTAPQKQLWPAQGVGQRKGLRRGLATPPPPHPAGLSASLLLA